MASKSQKQLQRDVARLENQVAVLHKQLATSGWGRFVMICRRMAIAILVILCGFLLNLSISALWLNRTLTDTDSWVSKTSAIVSDPNVRTGLSSTVASDVFQQADVESQVKQVLPERISGLSPALTQSMQDFTARRVDRVLQSDGFLRTWEAANRSAHQGLIQSLENQGASTPESRKNLVYIDNDQLLLNLQPVFRSAQSQLVDSGLSFVGRINPDRVQRTIVLTKIDNMAMVLMGYNAVSRFAMFLPIAGIIAGVGAIMLARDRRRVLMWVAIVTAIMALANVQLVYLAQFPVIKAFGQSLAQSGTASGQAVYSILSDDLMMMNLALLKLSLVVWLGTLIAGPSKPAIWIRDRFAGAWRWVESL